MRQKGPCTLKCLDILNHKLLQMMQTKTIGAMTQHVRTFVSNGRGGAVLSAGGARPGG